jgi:hypothetical protein
MQERLERDMVNERGTLGPVDTPDLKYAFQFVQRVEAAAVKVPWQHTQAVAPDGVSVRANMGHDHDLKPGSLSGFCARKEMRAEEPVFGNKIQNFWHQTFTATTVLTYFPDH